MAVQSWRTPDFSCKIAFWDFPSPVSEKCLPRIFVADSATTHYYLGNVTWKFCSFHKSTPVSQLSNRIISMIDCVLTLSPHKCDITTEFIEEVEKVERNQCDDIHSSTRWNVMPCHQHPQLPRFLQIFRGIWPMPLSLLNHFALELFAQRTRIPTSARSIGFCAIWVCISSSSSSNNAEE